MAKLSNTILIILTAMASIILLINIVPISAWTVNTFNNSQSNEYLTYTNSSTAFTRYISLPNSTAVNTAYLNLTGNTYTNYCYQETANVSTGCGGLATGTYGETYGGGEATVYMNYTKPANATSNSLWEVSSEQRIQCRNATAWITINDTGAQDFTYYYTNPAPNTNYTIPASCWAESPLQFRITSYGGASCGAYLVGNDTAKSTYDGNWGTNARKSEDADTWADTIPDQYHCFGTGRVWEEAMLWAMSTTYAQNVSVYVNNTLIYSYDGDFNQTNNKTNNFNSSLNNYLSSCNLLNGYCIIPMIFNSQSPGVIRYSDLKVQSIETRNNYSTNNATVVFSSSVVSTANVNEVITTRNNYISVNSTAYPEFNVSANVTLYNVPVYGNPAVFKDGVYCSPSVCRNYTSLQAGNVSFFAPSWSDYTIGQLSYLADGLKFYYGFNGNLIDSVAGNNLTNFTSANNVTYQDGGIGGTRKVKLTDTGLVSLSNSGISGNDNRTLSFWSQINETSTYKLMVQLGYQSANNAFAAAAQTGTWFLQGNAGPNDYVFGTANTNWNNHIITYNGTTALWYVNGVLTGTYVHGFSTTNNPISINHNLYVPSPSINNLTIDEVGIWNRSISTSEVAMLYNNGRGLIYSDGLFYDANATPTIVPNYPAQSAWAKKRLISGFDSTAAVSYVTIPYQTGMAPNFGDVRFVNYAQTSQLPYYIESSNSTSATFRIATGGNGTTIWNVRQPSYYYKLDETSGDAYDSSGNGLNLTYVNGTGSYVSGKLGNAFRLKQVSGNTANLNRTNNVADRFGTGNFTIVLWVNATGFGAGGTELVGLAQTSTGGTIVGDSAGNMVYAMGGPGLASTGNVMDSNWHRVVFVRRGNNIYSYRDGVAAGSAAFSYDINDATTPFKLYTGANSGNVTLDDIAAYKGYAWSDAEILADYNNGVGKIQEYQPSIWMFYNGPTNVTTSSLASVYGSSLKNAWLFNNQSTSTITKTENYLGSPGSELNLNSYPYMYQTFTIGANGANVTQQLKFVEVYLRRQGNLNATIYITGVNGTGYPDPTVIYSSVPINTSTVPISGGVWYSTNITMPPVNLTKGGQYAIYINCSSTCDGSNFLGWGEALSNTYPGGWNNENPRDSVFAIYSNIDTPIVPDVVGTGTTLTGFAGNFTTGKVGTGYIPNSETKTLGVYGNISTAKTVSLWVKRLSPTGWGTNYGRIFAVDDTWQAGAWAITTQGDGGSTLFYTAFFGGSSPTFSGIDDNFHNIIVSANYNTSKYQVYFDGVQVGTNLSTGASDANKIMQLFGGQGNQVPNNTTIVDDVMIFNSDITPTQINNLYRISSPTITLGDEQVPIVALPNATISPILILNRTTVITQVPLAGNLSSGILAYWTMNDASGTDVVNGIYNLTYAGTMSVNQPGVIGNGTSWSAGTGTPISPIQIRTNNFSVSFWAKWNTLNAFTAEGVIGGTSNFGLGIGSGYANNNKISVWLGDGSSWGGVNDMDYPANINTWYHVVVTRSGTNVTLYVNGTARVSGTLAPNYDVGGAGVNQRIGTGGATSDTMNGFIDEVGWWNRPLTADEVSNLYNNGSGLVYGSGIPVVTQVINFSVNISGLTPGWNSNQTTQANATLTVSRPSTALCFQESANQTNQTGMDGNCNLNYNGAYAILPNPNNWGDCNIGNPALNYYAYDGSYTTCVGSGSTSDWLYISYKKPAYATSAIWQTKGGQSPNAYRNFTLPDSCFNGNYVAQSYSQATNYTTVINNSIKYSLGVTTGFTSVNSTSFYKPGVVSNYQAGATIPLTGTNLFPGAILNITFRNTQTHDRYLVVVVGNSSQYGFTVDRSTWSGTNPYRVFLTPAIPTDACSGSDCNQGTGSLAFTTVTGLDNNNLYEILYDGNKVKVSRDGVVLIDWTSVPYKIRNIDHVYLSSQAYPSGVQSIDNMQINIQKPSDTVAVRVQSSNLEFQDHNWYDCLNTTAWNRLGTIADGGLFNEESIYWSTNPVVSQTTVGLGGLLQTIVSIPIALTDGIYNWFWTLFGLNGNQAITTPLNQFDLEATMPQVSLISPAANGSSTTSPTIFQVYANYPSSANLTLNVNGSSGITWADGLKNYWAFNENNGINAIDIISGNNISLSNSSMWKPGKNLYSIGNNGTTYTANSSSALFSSGTEYTIAFWYNVNQTTTGYEVMVSNTLDNSPATSGKFIFGTTPSNGQLDIRTAGQDLVGFDISTGSVGWHHVAMSLKSGEVAKIYVDGANVKNSTAITFTGFDASGLVRITPDNVAGWGQATNRYVDELGVWNRSLSAYEISQLYNGGVGTTYSNGSNLWFYSTTINNPTQGTNNINVTLPIAGYYSYNATISNPGGLTNSTETRNFLYDPIPPNVTIINPATQVNVPGYLNSTNMTNGLVAYWNFNSNSTGSYTDVHSGKWNLTCTGGSGCPTVSGKINNAYQSPGTAKPYPRVNGAGNGNLLGTGGNTIAINCWVNKSDTNTYIAFMSANYSANGNFFAWTSRAGEGLYWEGTGSGGIVGGYAPGTTNTWNMYTYSINGGNWSIWKNGVQLGNGTGTSWPTTTATFGLGDTNGGGNIFKGQIDECGVWNRSLTSTEISTLYNGGTGKAYNEGYTYFSNNLSYTNQSITNFTVNVTDNFGLGNSSLTINGGAIVNESSSLNPNLIHQWRFNEVTNTTLYDTLGRLNLTGLNGNLIPGKINNAYSITAGTSGINASIGQTPQDIGNYITVSFWFKRTSDWFGAGTYPAIFSTGGSANNFGMNANQDNSGGGIFMDGGNCPQLTSTTNNTWMFITAQWDLANDRCILYKDGVLVGNMSHTATFGGNNITLFGSPTNPSQYMRYADFDDFRIYNKLLSQSEINSIYNSGLGSETNDVYTANYTNTITVDNGGVLQAIVAIPVSLLDGVYNWFWSIFDLAGNNVQTSQNNTLLVDTTNPLISFVSPTYANGANVSTRTIPIVINLTETNPNTLTYNVWSSTWSSSTTYSAIGFGTTTTVAHGQPFIGQYAGQDTIKGIGFVVYQNYTLTSVTKASGLTCSGAVTVRLSNSSNGAVNLGQATFTGNVATFSSPLNLTNGTKYFLLIMNGVGCNHQYTASTVNLPMTTIGSNSTWRITSNSNDGNEETNMNNRALYNFVSWEMSNPTTIPSSITTPADGLYYYNVTTVDIVGNFNSTETRQITLDTYTPVVTVLTPNNYTLAGGSTQPVWNGLRYYWNFDTSGNKVDMINSTIINTFGSSLYNSSGKSGGSWQGNSVGFGNVSMTLVGNMTISMWMRNYDNWNDGSITNWFEGIDTVSQLNLQSSNCPQTGPALSGYFGTRGGYSHCKSTPTIFTNSSGWFGGAWHHLVITLNDGNVTKLYLNGVENWTEIDPSFIPTNNNLTGVWAMGTTQQSSIYTMNSNNYMDEFGVWNRVLNSTEVAQLYNSGAGMFYNGTTYSNTIANSSIYANATQNFSVSINDLYGGSEFLNSSLSANIAHYYNFNQTLPGNKYYDSIRGWNITAFNNPLVSSGGPSNNSYVNCTGQSSYVNDTTGLSQTSSFSVSLWVKSDNTGSAGLQSFTGEFLLGSGTTDWLGMNSFVLYAEPTPTTPLTTNFSMPAGNWTHVVVTSTSGEHKAYANGILVGQSSSSASRPTNVNTTVSICAQPISNTLSFNGAVTQLIYWDRVLSQSEITYIYSQNGTENTSPPTSSGIANATLIINGTNNIASVGLTGLKHRYPFDESSGNISIDTISGNNMTGLLGNFTTAGKYSNAYITSGSDVQDLGFTLQSMYGTNSSFSECFWAYRNGPMDYGGSARITGNDGPSGVANNQYAMYTEVDDFHMYIRGTSGSLQQLDGGIVPLDTWTFVCGVYDGNIAKFYYNNVLQSQATVGSLDATGQDTVYFFGRPRGIAYSPINLKVDELRFYNKSLTVSDINDILTQTARNTVTPAPNTFTTIISIPLILADGIFNWFWSIFDFAGNNAQTQNYQTTIDTTAPLISFVPPTYNNGSVIPTRSIPIALSITEANFNSLTISAWSSSWSSSASYSTLTTNPIYSNGLISYWDFNEGTGTNARNIINSSKNGTLTSGANWTSGISSNAVNLSGSPQYVSSTFTVPAGAAAKSISVWYYLPGSHSGTYVVVDSGSAVAPAAGFGIAHGYNPSDNKFFMHGQGADIVSTDSFSTAGWYHLVITDNGAGFRTLYVNGINEGTRTDSFNTGIQPLLVGQYAGGSGQYAIGKVDELGVWNRSLSSTEVATLYNSGIGTFYSTNDTLTYPSTITVPADGAYNYQATATDTVGHTNSTEVRSIYIDTYTPNVTMINPPTSNLVGWNYQKVVSVVGGVAALTDFTAYLNVSYSSNMKVDFSDLRFYDGACANTNTPLSFEFDKVINSSSAGVWVKIPTLNPGTNSICMFYGNANATNGQNAANAWDSNYFVVMHFNEANISAGNYLVNSKDGTNFLQLYGTPTRISGRLGNAINLSTGSYARGTGQGYNIPNTWTTETSSYAYGSAGAQRVFLSKLFSRGSLSYGFTTGQSSSGNYGDCFFGNNVWNSQMWMNDSVGQWNVQECYSTNGVVDSTYGFTNLVATGVRTNSGGSGGSIYQTGDWALSYFEGSTSWGNAAYDEVRMSSVQRSSAWLNRSYEDLRGNNTMYSFGTEGPATGAIVSPYYNNGTINISATIDDRNYVGSTTAFDGIMSYYKLDETSGTVIDALGIRNGTNNGATAGVSGKINNSYQFTASQDIQINSDFSISDSITLSAWVYPTSVFDMGVISKRNAIGTNNWQVYYEGSTQQWEFFIWDSTNTLHKLELDHTLNLSQWEFVTATYNGSVMKFYINGQLAQTLNATGLIKNDALSTKIGHEWYGSYWRGKIDEVGVWNRAISASEISDLYNNATGRTYGGNSSFTSSGIASSTLTVTTTPTSWPSSLNSALYSYYNLNDNSTSTILDAISNKTLNATNYLGQSNAGLPNYPGKFVTSYLMNDSSDLMYPYSSSTTLGGSNQFTVSMWTYSLAATPGEHRYYWQVGSQVNPSRAVRRTVTANGGYLTYRGGGECNGPSNIPLNQWVNIITTYDGTNARVYLNGTLEITCAQGAVDSNVSFSVGWPYLPGLAGYSPMGYVDEVAVWNRVLSPSEMASVYNNGVGVTYTGPIVYANTTTYSPGVYTTVFSQVVNLADGFYNWLLSVFDFAGNNAQKNGNFTVDTTYPQISFTSPTYPTGVNISSLIVPIAFTLNETNPSTVTYNIWGGNNYTSSITYPASSTSFLHTPSVYWKFDEASGPAYDSSGNNITLSNFTGSGRTTGKLGSTSTTSNSGATQWSTSANNAFTFNTNNFTLIYWFNNSNCGDGRSFGQSSITTGWDIICGKYGSLNRQLFRAVSSDRLFTNGPVTADGQWHRIAFVREGLGTNQFKVYVDGALSNTATLNLNITDSSSTFIFENSGATQGTMYVDDLGIYNGYAFTSAEILTDYNGGVGRTQNSYSGGYPTSITAPADGVYSYNVTALDLAGNFNSTETRQITLDVLAPNGTILSPNNYTAYTYGNETVGTLWNNLNAYWKLDDTTGPVLDSFNGYNGTNNAATRGQSGKIGNSFQFTTGYVSTGLSLAPISKSVSSWVYWDGTNDTYGWAWSAGSYTNGSNPPGRPFGLFHDYSSISNKLIFYGYNVDDFTLNNAGNLAANTWYHVVITYNGTMVKAYVNGNLTDTAIRNLETTAETFTIGVRRDTGFSNGWRGKIDEVSVWNREINATEVSTLYNNGTGRTFLGTQAYTVISNYTYYNYSNQTFVLNATDNLALRTATLYITSNVYLGVNTTIATISLSLNGTNTIGDPLYKGFRFVPARSFTLTNITLMTGDTSSTCRVTDDSNNILSSSSVSGSVANFDYNLTAGTAYRMVCGGVGATMGYNPATFTPINTTYGNITNQIYSGSVNEFGMRTVQSITIRETGAVYYTNTTSIDLGSAVQNLVSLPVALADGIYSWFWTVLDWAGNLFTTPTQQTNIDTNSPLINITYPVNNANYTYIPTNLSATIYDANPSNVSLILAPYTYPTGVDCYQETATSVTACGGLATGAYGSFIEGSGPAQGGFVFMNYTKPSGYINATWQIKIGTAAAQNVSLPTACQNAYPDKLVLRLYGRVAASLASRAECFDGATWQVLASRSGGAGNLAGSSPTEVYDGNWSTAACSGSGVWWTGTSPFTCSEGAMYEEAVIWRLTSTVPAAQIFLANTTWYNSNYMNSNGLLTGNLFVRNLSSDQQWNNWTIVYTDVVNHISSSTNSFFVDTILPVVALVPPTDANNSDVGRAFIRYNATATDANLASLTVKLFNHEGVQYGGDRIGTVNGTYGNVFGNVSGLVSDDYYLYAIACDILNNCKNVSNTIHLDLGGPTVNFTAPTPAQNNLTTAYDLTSIFANVTIDDLYPENITLTLTGPNNYSSSVSQTFIHSNDTRLTNQTWGWTNYSGNNSDGNFSTYGQLLDTYAGAAKNTSVYSNFSLIHGDTTIPASVGYATTHFLSWSGPMGSASGGDSELLFAPYDCISNLTRGLQIRNRMEYIPTGCGFNSCIRVVAECKNNSNSQWVQMGQILSGSIQNGGITASEFRLFEESVTLSDTLGFSNNFTNLTVDGAYNLSALAYDQVGNRDLRSRLIYITGNNPYNMSYEFPTPLGGGITLNYIPVNVSVIEPNIKNITIRLFGQNGSLYNSTASVSYVNNFATRFYVPDGQYYFNATAFDIFGHRADLPQYMVQKEYGAGNTSICKDISFPGEYTLIQNLNKTTGVCLNVLTTGVTINCQGYSITVGVNGTAVATSSANTVLRNCNLISSVSGGTGLSITGGSVTVTNSTLDGFYGVFINSGSATISSSTIANNVYGLFVTGTARTSLTGVTFTNNQYGIYHNYTTVSPGGSSGSQVWGPSGAGTYNNLVFSGTATDIITLIGSSYNNFNTLSSSTGGEVRYTNSSNNYMYKGTLGTGGVVLAQNSMNNKFHDTTYSGTETVDNSSQLIRSWTTTVTTRDPQGNNVGGTTVHVNDGSNRTIYTNPQGTVTTDIYQYINNGTVTQFNPYEIFGVLTDYGVNLFTDTQITTVDDETRVDLTFSQQIRSTLLSRQVGLILMAMILLIGLAASTGFFIVKMRNGESVVDIWKYFIIMMIWNTIFLVLFIVLGRYVMQFFYP